MRAIGNYRRNNLGFVAPLPIPSQMTAPAPTTAPFVGYEMAEAAFCALTAWTLGKMKAQEALNNAKSARARREAKAALDAFGSAPAPGSFNATADQVCRDVRWKPVSEVGESAQLCDDAINLAADGAQISGQAGRTGAQRLRQALKDRGGCRAKAAAQDESRRIADAVAEFARDYGLAAGACWYGTGRAVEAKRLCDDGVVAFHAARGAAMGLSLAQIQAALRDAPKPDGIATKAEVDDAVYAVRAGTAATSFAASNPAGAGACWETGFKPASAFASGSPEAAVAGQCQTAFDTYYAQRDMLISGFLPPKARLATLLAAMPMPAAAAGGQVAAARGQAPPGQTASGSGLLSRIGSGRKLVRVTGTNPDDPPEVAPGDVVAPPDYGYQTEPPPTDAPPTSAPTSFPIVPILLVVAAAGWLLLRRS